ncbi:hypothetical protein GCM10010517_57560 [Streptosporangium fragile]|uniref:OmpR/PhoB-type domain-containing protein n=1 Tax=Streptosporangium fragile TaxID=46186 RepID=A0ABN3W5Y0_9ACTN
MGTGFEFRVLGPVEVLHDGRPVPVRAAKQRVLLASLLLDAGRVVPVGTLVTRLWGESPPDGARNTLQNYVMRLRRVLAGAARAAGTAGDGENGPVLTRPQGYLIEAAGDAVDLHRFDALVRHARAAAAAGAADRASVLLREALGLWRGQPLSDVPSEPLQREVVPVLAERRLGAVELRIQADLLLGRHAEVLPELRELTTGHPLQERFWAQRMLALYRSGRQGEALECYRAVSGLLAEELGVDPGAELRELHRRILAADPALMTPVPACARPPSTTGGGPGDCSHGGGDDGDDGTAGGGVSGGGRSDGGVSGGGRSDDAHRGAPAGAGPRGAARAPGNLPAEMTTFVGRERQLADARRLLESARLVTLTGVGGVGKTRLALRAATRVARSFPDGVWLADLAPLTEPELLDRAVAEALGVRDQSARPGVDVLVEHLRGKETLLVLDNCEHVVGAVATLTAALLRAAPGLRVLATSRQRLGLPGEHFLRVPPLTVPARDDAGQPLTRYEAVRLLTDRTAASAPDFRITERNRGAVAQLCRRLDGIPLAIELAAVRLGTLSIEEILERLDDRFRLLSDGGSQISPRYHRTLRGVVDWSHDLCTEQERRLWARLSVFSGGFDLAAAETVCSGDGLAREDVMDVLAGLAHKSIVTVTRAGGRTRYRLPETIRQYGRQRLRDLGQDTALRRRHLDHYRALVRRAATDWCGPREVEWLSRLRRELPNLRTALEFSISEPGEAQAGVEIATNLTRTRCWFFSSTLGEGRHWLGRALALAPCPPGPLRVSAAALHAWIALFQGDQRAAVAFLADHRDAARRLGDTSAAAVTYIEGAHAMLVRGDARAIPMLARARERFRRGGEIGDAHMATMLWAMSAAFFGDRDTAVAAGLEYLADAETRGAAWAYSWALWSRGLMELRHGDLGEAVALFRDSLRRQWAIDDSWGPVWGVEGLAWTAAAAGRHDYAARLLGAAHRLRQSTGVVLAGLRPFRDAHAEADGLVRLALGSRAYETAFDEGARTGDVTRLALGENPVT